MRQLFLLLSVLLLGLSWAVAQNSTPSTSTSSSGSGQSSASSASQTSSGGETTVQGCLSGSSGSFTLTDKSGTAYQLTGDTAKLSEHVGHEVKVTGTTGSGASSAGSSSSDSSASSPSSGASSGSQQTLQVTSVKHVAKSCQSGGGMSH